MGFLDSIGNALGSIGGALTGGLGNLVSGGLGLVGSYMGGEATKDAADKSSDALWGMYNQNRSDMLPLLQLLAPTATSYANAANNPNFPSIPSLQNTVSVDYANDPIYQQQKDEILKTLNRQFASRGKLNSSDADNAIMRNLSGLMSDSYNRSAADVTRTNENLLKTYGLNYGQNTDAYSRLLDMLKVGSGAASSAGQYAANTGNALSNVYTGAGQNEATMYGGMAGSAMGALNNYQLMQLLSSMKK